MEFIVRATYVALQLVKKGTYLFLKCVSDIKMYKIRRLEVFFEQRSNKKSHRRAKLIVFDFQTADGAESAVTDIDKGYE